VGLAFKDQSGISVFPLAPVEILWIIMVTSGFPAMGLGMEIAAPDIMTRPPHNVSHLLIRLMKLKMGVFTWEVLLDMTVYGFWAGALCVGSFAVVVFGFGDGNLGYGCNDTLNNGVCTLVFRARATTFTCLTWFALFLAWEMIDLRRSFFRMQPGSKHYLTQWIRDVWRNQFLFWSIVAGFVTVFPVIYIPVINTTVFKHAPISWEWGIVFVETFIFFLGVESWKWGKRIYYRRVGDTAKNPEADLEKNVFSAYTSTSRSIGGKSE
jgi:P-type Na+/K+ transporter